MNNVFDDRKDDYYLRIAEVVASRATCSRRNVGCVLVDSIGRIIATGYNGTPRGYPNCTAATPCPGSSCASGEGLDQCEAVHAEQNALMQCPDVENIFTCYTTTSPCVHCVKMLLNTGTMRIVFRELYPQPESEKMWMRQNRLLSTGRRRSWIHLDHLDMILRKKP